MCSPPVKRKQQQPPQQQPVVRMIDFTEESLGDCEDIQGQTKTL
jgi:hypothetical protein